MNKDNFEKAKWIPIFVLAVILMLIYKTFDNITGITSEIKRFLWIISPLLFGILFSYFLYYPSEKLNKLYSRAGVKIISKRSKGFSILTLFLLLALIAVFVIRTIIPVLFTSIVELIDSVDTYQTQLMEYLDNLPEDSIWVAFDIVDRLREYSTNFVNQFFDQDGMEQVTRLIISLADGVVSVVLGLIISLYILLELERIKDFFRRMNKTLFQSEKVRARLIKYLEQINKVLITFIASKGLDSVINLVVITSILLIFNVQYASLLGLIAGMLNFIPYLGSLIAVISISVINVLTGGLSKAIQVLIVLLIFQQIDGNFIEPRIMRTSLKISPILVIVSVLAGGAYFGLLGMFFAVPVITIIKQILIEYVSSGEE